MQATVACAAMNIDAYPKFLRFTGDPTSQGQVLKLDIVLDHPSALPLRMRRGIPYLVPYLVPARIGC